MGIFSLVYSVWNSLFAILRWLRRLTASPKPAVEGNKVDKPTEAATEPKSPEWLTEKALFLGMPVSEKRVHYKCGFNYVTLNDIQTWTEYFNDNKEWLQKLAIGRLDEVCDIDPELNEKISIWRGDITTLEVDAIVNAANERLLGGGGVDGAIHKAAGEMLRNECATLNGCKVGEAKVSGGYQLPAKYVIHTVGPRGSGDEELMNCYQNSLNIMKELQQRSVAFPCISTGIYGFPNERAANIALKTARKFLQENRDVVDRIIFCLFMPVDVEMYEVLMQKYFPVCEPPPERTHAKETEPEALPSEEKTTVPIPDDETVKETPPGVTVIKTESKEEPAECQPLIKQVDEQKETNQAGGQGHSEEADKAVSDRAVSDKAVSDKAVSDKAVSDKAVSDKAVSDRAVADRAVSDRAVSDRAVSDKAVSDKAVADKAVADKAVSDKAVSDKAVSDKAVSDAVKQATENGLEISDKTESLKSDEKRMSTLNTETHSEPGTAEQDVSGADVGDMEVKPAEEITKTDETEQTLDVSSEHKVTEPDPQSHNQENDTLRTEHSIDKDKETTPATAEEHKRPSDKHEGSNVEGMEPGTGEQSNITVTDKEEENHSLVSNVTDSEQISLSQAQNQTTESKSSEEQHVKTDKNENLPPQAITESKM